MRKILSLLMLFCMFVGTAWAQTPIQSSAFDASKTYRVYNNKEGEELKAWIVNANNRGWMAAYDNKDNNQIWKFIPGEGDNAGKFLLQNVKTEKYLGQVGGSNGVGAGDQNSACYYQMVWKEGDNTKVKFVSGAKANTLFNDGGGKLAGWENDAQEWFSLEEAKMLASTTVRYTFTYKGKVKGTQETEVAIGAAFPEITTAFPMGVVATKPAGVVSEENNKQTIVLTVDNSKLPFVAASDYNSIEHWYYMNIRDDGPTYMYYDSSISYIKADKSAIDKKNKDIYSWAFIGSPWDGFSIVNKAAGATMVLSSPVVPNENTNADQVARMVVKQGAAGNLVWTIMNPTHDNAPAGSFYVQHPTATNWAINRQGFNGGNALCYWDNRDTGSSFQIEERQMGALADLEDLLTDANALLTTVNANIGTEIGEYTQATADALTTAITTASGIVEAENATADDVANLQAAMDAVKVILPTTGKFYLIHSSLSKFAEHQEGKVKAAYSDGSNVKWTTANEDDKTFYWQAVATSDGGVVFQNAKDGKYMIGNSEQSGQWTVSDTYSEAAKIDIKLFAKGETAEKNEYGVILNGWQMHCAGHTEGKGESGNVVSWNTDKANSASSWYVVEVKLPVFYDVTYNFVYNKEVKFTQTASIKEGGAYPDIVVPVIPYGVTAKATKPEGTVTKNEVINFELTVEHELPFKTATSVGNITTWYYAQMHANSAVTSYVEDNKNENNNVEWADKTVAADEIDSHLWGFVGDIWSGIKMVNKGTGRAIVSTSGAAVMGDAANATAFVPVYSNGAYSDWFCLKYPTSNYLNASGDKINSYGSADNGSSFFLTEYKETEVVVSNEAGYATLYLGQATYIPADVEVYAVTGIEGGWATMTAVEGVLPANTGVILKNAGTYTFKTAGATGSVEGNLLRGSVEDTYVEGLAYVLANGTEGVGLYRAKLNMNAEGAEGTTHFLNNANKAYLPKPAEASARFLSFDFGTETAIENIEGAEAENAVVYDLSGRRVQKAQKGVFIVNGKVVIK